MSAPDVCVCVCYVYIIFLPLKLRIHVHFVNTRVLVMDAAVAKALPTLLSRGIESVRMSAPHVCVCVCVLC